MTIVTGYLTNPNLSDEEFKLRNSKFEKLGLETRLFNEGLRNGNMIGPNGILLSGKSNLNSTEIMEIMYGSNSPENIKGLTYDISSSYGGEDFEVRKLKFGSYNSYFALRVNIQNDENRVLDFNTDYLENQRNIGFRYVESDYVVYEYLTNEDNLSNKIKEVKLILLKEKLKLNEKETTIIRKLNS